MFVYAVILGLCYDGPVDFYVFISCQHCHWFFVSFSIYGLALINKSGVEDVWVRNNHKCVNYDIYQKIIISQGDRM